MEDYEKKYKDALANARQEYTTTENVERKQWLEELFPELKESEDERIRKALVDALNKNLGNGIEKYGTTLNAALAWLEKQGESSDQIHYWTEEELDQAAEEYSLGHSVRKECFIDGALWMKEKLKRNDTKD